jgi:hypothetical protein
MEQGLELMRKLSRMETNKEVRRILNRHMVDLAYCQYSCYGAEVRLTGWLAKGDGSDFNAPQIESMIHEFHRYLPGMMIHGEFDNWNFNSERICFVGERDSLYNGSEEEEQQVVYEIDLDDYDFEAS